MALSGPPFVGSGRFVPVRAWSCPKHDYPQYHECDCGYCSVGEWECDECATAAWVDQFNEDGSRKMRELGMYEGFLLDGLSAAGWRSASAPLLTEILSKGTGAGVVWQEDVLIPVVKSADA